MLALNIGRTCEKQTLDQGHHGNTTVRGKIEIPQSIHLDREVR